MAQINSTDVRSDCRLMDKTIKLLLIRGENDRISRAINRIVWNMESNAVNYHGPHQYWNRKKTIPV